MDNTLENIQTQPKAHPLRKNILNALNQYKWPLILAIIFATIGSITQIVGPNRLSEITDLITQGLRGSINLTQISHIGLSLVLLYVIGAGFEGRKAIKKIKPTVIATFIKLIGIAAVCLPIAVAMGYRNQELVAILIMVASPTTVSCYIMSENMDNDGVLASSIIVLTTLLSSITLTGWIYLLRSMGLI